MPVDFDAVAGYYDQMYVDAEGYRKEVEQVVQIVERYNRSGCRRLLDLACGTGEQSRLLTAHFEVFGLDLSAGMLAVARRKVPDAVFYQGDLFDFHLTERFGAVVNLYGSVGFARDADQLRSGMKCAYDALEPGGVFLLTPWDTLETFHESMVADAATRDGISFCRMEAVRRCGETRAEVEMCHLIGKDGQIQERRERQEITLFREQEYRDALEQAGFILRERLDGQQFRMSAFVCTKQS